VYVGAVHKTLECAAAAGKLPTAGSCIVQAAHSCGAEAASCPVALGSQASLWLLGHQAALDLQRLQPTVRVQGYIGNNAMRRQPAEAL
jgi:hypothetical protein